MQIVGTVLGVPLGLASGYSIYRANFSAETACQNLRGNIVAMLDKNVDAGTRRMLVRRDIAAFERACGSVDPDAHAAFKALLSEDAPVAASTEKVKVVSSAKADRQPEAKSASKSGAKSEPKSDVALRPAIADKETTAVAAMGEVVSGDAGLSDARWLAAVRQALVAHAPERTQAAHTAASAPAVKPLRLERPVADQAPAPVLQPAWIVPSQAPAAAQPVPVTAARDPLFGDDRPVPPAPIPMNADDGARSGSWIAQIPFVGRVIERAAN